MCSEDVSSDGVQTDCEVFGFPAILQPPNLRNLTLQTALIHTKFLVGNCDHNFDWRFCNRIWCLFRNNWLRGRSFGRPGPGFPEHLLQFDTNCSLFDWTQQFWCQTVARVFLLRHAILWWKKTSGTTAVTAAQVFQRLLRSKTSQVISETNLFVKLKSLQRRTPAAKFCSAVNNPSEYRKTSVQLAIQLLWCLRCSWLWRRCRSNFGSHRFREHLSMQFQLLPCFCNQKNTGLNPRQDWWSYSIRNWLIFQKSIGQPNVQGECAKTPLQVYQSARHSPAHTKVFGFWQQLCGKFLAVPFLGQFFGQQTWRNIFFVVYFGGFLVDGAMLGWCSHRIRCDSWSNSNLGEVNMLGASPKFHRRKKLQKRFLRQPTQPREAAQLQCHRFPVRNGLVSVLWWGCNYFVLHPTTTCPNYGTVEHVSIFSMRGEVLVTD